jgi:hypothetical protein
MHGIGRSKILSDMIWISIFFLLPLSMAVVILDFLFILPCIFLLLLHVYILLWSIRTLHLN